MADLAGLGETLLAELCNVYGLAIKPAEMGFKNKLPAIEYVNGLFVATEPGKPGRLKIMKGSQLELQLLDLQWDSDQYGNLTENKNQPNHLTDALIYSSRAVMDMFQTLPSDPAPAIPNPYDRKPAVEIDYRALRDRDEMLAPATFDDGYGNAY